TEALKRSDLRLPERSEWRDARAHRGAVDKHHAGAALAKPAAELGGTEAKIIAQHVEQRRVRLGRNAVHRAVHLETDDHEAKLRLDSSDRILLRLWRGVEARLGSPGFAFVYAEAAFAVIDSELLRFLPARILVDQRGFGVMRGVARSPCEVENVFNCANASGAVRQLVGIESGVVSGLSNPNDSGVGTPVETTPWEAITRSLLRYIRQLLPAPNFLTIGSTRLKWASASRCGALSRA